MDSLVAAVRWDWFKLARRWMPWILLVILLLFSQLGVWAGFLAYQSVRRSGGVIPVALGPSGRLDEVRCSDVQSENAATLLPGASPEALQGLQAQCRQEQAQLQLELARQYQSFTLPGSIPVALDLGATVGLILVAILTASQIGTEYGWGTLRSALARGVGRRQFVASKLILLVLAAAAALVVIVVATAISSVAAAHLTSAPQLTLAAPSWGHAAVAFAKSWFALAVFVVFTAFVTLLTRSSAAGMAIAIGYYLAELIVVSILSGLLSWFDSVGHYLFGQNIAAWAGLSIFGQSQSSVGSLHAFLVLVVYAVVLGAASFWLFERRDVSGSSIA